MTDDADNVWRELKRLNIVPIQRYKIEPDPSNPLLATLKGSVIVEVKYDGQSWGRANVAELKLVRERPNARWKVDPAEVVRTLASREIPAVRENR